MRGTFASGPVRLEAGREFTITGEAVAGDGEQVSVTYPGLADDVMAGDRILVDDGRVVLEVLAARDKGIRTRVLAGGVVSDHKGLNLPGTQLSVPALSLKDEQDLRWALGLRADMIALSFVRGPEDAGPVRAIMDQEGARVPLIAKIEKPQAVQALPEILEAFDGLMVARGDLGVELPLEQVPAVQKRAIAMAGEKAKPVIVATQMLESMIYAPRPTRAEASDVANAVFEGADALMLSAETSVGEYPVQSVATMDRIIAAAEREYLHAVPSLARVPTTTGGAIARAAAEVAAIVGATALAAFTISGETARRLARYRSPIPLLAFTPQPATRSELTLSWESRPSSSRRSGTSARWSARRRPPCSAPAAATPVTRSSSWPAACREPRAAPTRCAFTASATPSPQTSRSQLSTAGQPDLARIRGRASVDLTVFSSM